MILDQRLKWKHHITELKSKVNRSLNILRTVTSLGWGADRKVLKRLYWAIGKSKIEYGCQLYGLHNANAIKPLITLNNEALRICTGAFRSSPIQSLYVEAEEPPLDLRWEELTMRTYYRIKATTGNQLNNTLDSSLDQLYIEKPKLQRPLGVRCRLMEEELNITEEPMPVTTSAIPPWTKRIPKKCLKGKLIKAPSNETHRATTFLEHNIVHSNSKSIFTDGSKTDTGTGFAALIDDTYIRGALPTISSIFTAELSAIEAASDLIISSTNDQFTIYTDSESALTEISNFGSNHPIAQTIQQNLHTAHQDGKDVTICKIPSHVGLTGNEAADKEARKAANMLGPHPNCVPHKDFYTIFKREKMKKWQARWDEVDPSNKLKRIRPNIGKWTLPSDCSRQYQVKLSRLRLGHTKLTHGHLMERSHPSTCNFCRTEHVTVQHLLMDCPNLSALRTTHRLPEQMALLLGESPPLKELMTFLKEIVVLHLI